MILSPFTPTLNYGQLVNRASPLNRDLISWWINLPLGGKGNTWFDIAGKNHGTLTNGPTHGGALGRPGGWGAMRFASASAQRVVIDDNPSVSMGDIDFTVSAWARAASNTRGGICSKFGANDLEWNLRWNTTPVFEFRVSSGAAFANLTTVSMAGIAIDTWYHVVGRHDSVGNLLMLNINDGTPATTAYTFGSYDSGETVKIGGDPAFTENFDGWIDSVRIYKRLLSDSEVNALYNEERQFYPTTLNRIRLPVLGAAAAAAEGGINMILARTVAA